MRCLLVLCFLLVACESDTDRIARLSRDQITASLVYQNIRERVDSLVLAEGRPKRLASYSPRTQAAIDTMVRRKNELDLANRELNKFMGR